MTGSNNHEYPLEKGKLLDRVNILSGSIKIERRQCLRKLPRTHVVHNRRCLVGRLVCFGSQGSCLTLLDCLWDWLTFHSTFSCSRRPPTRVGTVTGTRTQVHKGMMWTWKRRLFSFISVNYFYLNALHLLNLCAFKVLVEKPEGKQWVWELVETSVCVPVWWCCHQICLGRRRKNT